MPSMRYAEISKCDGELKEELNLRGAKEEERMAGGKRGTLNKQTRGTTS